MQAAAKASRPALRVYVVGDPAILGVDENQLRDFEADINTAIQWIARHGAASAWSLDHVLLAVIAAIGALIAHGHTREDAIDLVGMLAERLVISTRQMWESEHESGHPSRQRRPRPGDPQDQ